MPLRMNDASERRTSKRGPSTACADVRLRREHKDKIGALNSVDVVLLGAGGGLFGDAQDDFSSRVVG